MPAKSRAGAPVLVPEPLATETPVRTTADVLAGRLRLRLAGSWYSLPVLTIGENEDWVATLDAALEPLVNSADDDLPAIVASLEVFNDQLLGFIWSYDRLHLLPDQESIRRDIYPYEVLRAVMEIRAAANPTLGFALAQMLEEAERLTGASTPRSPSMSTSPTRTAGGSATSGVN